VAGDQGLSTHTTDSLLPYEIREPQGIPATPRAGRCCASWAGGEGGAGPRASARCSTGIRHTN
jgi:hypothetical protein